MKKISKSNVFKWNGCGNRVCIAALGVAVTISSSGSFAQTYDQQNSDGGKVFLLMPIIQGAFASALSSAASTLFGNIFNKLFNPVTCWSQDMGSNQTSPNCAPPAGNVAGTTAGFTAAPGFNPPAAVIPQMTPDQAREKLAQAPAFTLKIDKLSSDQPNLQPQQSLEFRKDPGSNDLTYSINTGDFFAMLFQTTVPGRVRILNEAGGQTTPIGYYEVIPDSDNRMPRSRAMRVDPPAGTEYLHIEFTPCVSSGMLGDPRIAAFSPYMAPCSNESATKQFAGGKYVPPPGSKVIVNLDSPDPTQPIAAARELSKGETLTMRIIVNHMAPSNGV